MPEPYLNPNQVKFAAKLSQYIEQSGRQPGWIIKQLGYRHRSILNRWRDGEAKMPFEALIKFCKICELDKAQSIELTNLAGYEREVSFILEILQEDNFTGGEDIFTKFGQKSGALRQHIRVQEFQTLVNECTRDFTGRQFIFQAIDAWLVNPQLPSGYIIIQGEPGIGKTALMGHLVKQRGYIHHFNIAVQNVRSARDFLANICAQLIIKYDLPYSTLPQEATQDSGFLSGLLTEVVGQADGKPVVILVDALDEVEDHSLPPHANRLLLPAALPDGVFFVLTSREQADYRLSVDRREDIYLRDDDPSNLEDVRQYIQDYLQRHSTQLTARIAAWDIMNEEFIEVLTEKSQGNFMYLVHVLRDIREGKLTADTLDDIRQLPQGLRGYYQRHWRAMQAQDEARFEKYYEPVVCYLATAREPVNMEQLIEWTKLPPGRLKEVIEMWREFLNEGKGADGQSRYRIYHASFQDFLKEEVGLSEYHSRIAQSALNKIAEFNAPP